MGRPVHESLFVFLSSLDEGPEDGLLVVEVVVDDVDEEAGVHEVVDNLGRGRFGVVYFGPLLPKFVCFILKGIMNI